MRHRNMRVVVCSLLAASFVLYTPLVNAAPAQKKKSAVTTQKKATVTVTKKKPERLRIEVPCRAWVPNGTMPKVILVCVHGLGLNSASYEDFGKRMSSLGVGTFAVDVRGFGTWMQVKGKEKVDFDACVEDVKQGIEILHKAYPGVPVVLLGESMGGAIALRFTSMYPELVSGLISAVPSGDRFQQSKTELKVALNLLKSPNKPMNVGDKVIEQATCDEECASEWKNDPLNRLELSANELWQFQKFMNDNHESAEKITSTPVLVIQGFKDRLVKPKGTMDIFNQIKSPEKMLIVVGDREHLIFEESQFTEEVVGVVNAWIKNHTGTSVVTATRPAR